MSDSAGSSPFATLSLDPVSTVDRVAEELRRSLFEGELEPGTALREVALADALGVSRSTVREALGMLVAEGLADRVPNKGTQVRRLDPDQVRDVCEARMVIETAGVRRWNECRRDPPQRRTTRAGCVRRPDPRRLHRRPSSRLPTSPSTGALSALTGSERLVAVAESLHAEVRLALAHVDRARGNATEQVHSHADLLAMLEKGDLEAAADELADHLGGAEASMLEAIGRRDPD